MSEVLNIEYLKKVLYLFGRQKRYIPFLIASFAIGSIIDFIGIGFVGPFLALFIDPDSVIESNEFFERFTQEELILYAGIFLVAIFGLRVSVSYFIFRFILSVTFNRQIFLREELANAFFSQDFSNRLEKNSGYYQTAIVSLCTQYTNTSTNCLRLISECITLSVIIILLCFVDIQILITIFIILAFFLIAYFKLITSSISSAGKNKIIGLNKLNQSMSEIIKGLKEIKILNLGNFFANRIFQSATITAESEKKIYLHSFLPRYFLEFVLVFTLTFVLIFSIQSGVPIEVLIAKLGVFLVASLRLLPASVSIVQTLNNLSIDKPAVLQLYEEVIKINKTRLQSLGGDNKKINFELKSSKLELKNIFFKYPNTSDYVLEDINLTINNGDFIGIRGESGSGKTTLIDLILGIYRPTSGEIEINGINIHESLNSWQSNIAYLPQETFLIDGTVIENIALGMNRESFSEKEIINSLKRAQIFEHVNKLDEGIESQIGDAGLLLSGGQKQRLAIARAFFNKRNVFIFDESTSALDAASEEKILNQIYELSLSGATIIMISHKMSSLRNCNKIIDIDNKRIKKVN